MVIEKTKCGDYTVSTALVNDVYEVLVFETLPSGITTTRLEYYYLRKDAAKLGHAMIVDTINLVRGAE